MEWPLNPNEVIIVRPVLQWVDFEHSARYFGRIGGVCETRLPEPGHGTSSERNQPFPSVGCGFKSGLFCFSWMKALNSLNFSELQF